MSTSGDALARGHSALASGDWERAREAFEEAVIIFDSPEALDGLGRSLWWLRDERGAVVQRERAYAGFRRAGELARAARVALWLAREYGLAFGNAAAAPGLARPRRAPPSRCVAGSGAGLAGSRPVREQPGRRRRGGARGRRARGRGEVRRLRPRAPCPRPARPRRGHSRRRRPRARTARRGDGGCDERRGLDHRDLRRHLLHAHARVRARRGQREAPAVERCPRSSFARTTTSRFSRSAERAARTCTPRTGGSTPRRRSSRPRCASWTLPASVRDYAPPGHLPKLYAGSEIVEFSPTAELQQTLAVVERNMAAAAS